MSSTRSAVLGVQVPRVHLSPKAHDLADADDAIQLGSRYGLTPDPWQELVLRDWLGRRRDGKWASSTVALSVPRQNGKNAVIEIRELFGMVYLGEKWLHTAHEVKTARRAFMRLASFFENERMYPELAELVAENGIRRTNGQEAIILRNGGSVEFVARSRGSARGFTVDCLAIDEAQEFTDEALEALRPTTAAAPQGNPQRVYTGTPPGPRANGEVFTRLRQLGLEGKARRRAYAEWSAEPGCDLDSVDALAQANPSLGLRLTQEECRGEREEFDDAGYARERLGMWDEAVGSAVLTAAAWLNVTDSDVDVRALPAKVLALDVAPGHSSASIVAAGFDPVRGFPVFELAERRAGASWLVDRAVAVARQYDAKVALDSSGPIGSLIPEFEKAGLPLSAMHDVKGSEYVKACGLIAASVNGRTTRHRGEPEFTSAVTGLRVRKVQDGFKFSRSDSSVDITPLVAATVALWSAAQGRAALDDAALLQTFY